MAEVGAGDVKIPSSVGIGTSVGEPGAAIERRDGGTAVVLAAMTGTGDTKVLGDGGEVGAPISVGTGSSVGESGPLSMGSASGGLGVS